MFDLLELFNSCLETENHYSIKNEKDEAVITFTTPGTPKDEISVEKFEDRIEVVIKGKKTKIHYAKYFNYGETLAEYKNGILTIIIKKTKQKGKKITIS